MFDKTIAFLKGVGVKLGLIQQLKTIQDHKKVNVNEDAYARIAKNKAIYSGHYASWHDIEERLSNGKIAERTMKTLGMAKVVAEEMTTLIFNEKVKITIADDAASEFVLETLKQNGFYKNFSRYLEYGYGLGGMAVKVYFYNGQVKIAYAAADAFYPLSNDSENIDEALFVSEEMKDEKYYTLLEWHEWEGDKYVVSNELYQSATKVELGTKVALGVLYPDLEKRAVIEDLSRALFVYFKPNIANNKDLTSPLGISLFENSYDDLYMLDYMYDFWYNEFRLGKRRIAVDPSMLKPFPGIDGRPHMAFDPDETVFVALNGEANKVNDLSVEIRASDIIDSINGLLDVLSMKVGFNPGSFRFDGTGIKTATEVVSQNSKTYQTKNKHEVLVGEGIQELIQSIVEVGDLYGVYSGTLEFDIGIDFDDSIAQDRQENFNYYSGAVSMGLFPKEIAMQRIHDIPEKTAQEWLEMIRKEKAAENRLWMNDDTEIDREGVE